MYHLATRVVAGADVSPAAIAVILSRGWKEEERGEEEGREEEGRGEEGRGEEVGEDDGGGGRDEMVTVVDRRRGGKKVLYVSCKKTFLT